jgi:putative nucleotidyltransferase with HDIG domain
MLVHFVTDEPTKLPAVLAMLQPQHAIECHLLGVTDKRIISNGVLMVDVDLRKTAPVEQIKIILQDMRCISERLFVVQRHLHHAVAQAFALGATAVVSRPREVFLKLAQLEAAKRVAQADMADSPSGIANSAAAFASIFSAIREGKKLQLFEAQNATSEIINSIQENGLGLWLDDVRRYHEGTFQHCLLVTGVAVAFAMDIRFADADIKRLGLAATLHDIGKAGIPLSILDKPGRLDPTEEEVMRRHPALGHELLKGLAGIAPEILDGVRHHHEYLDGSGYPDRLKGTEISDLVRLLTISDIFAALIETRPYRPAMPRQEAYNILCSMDGKLEGSLVKAFRKVALTA